VNVRVPRTINRLSARTVTSLTEPKLHADGGGLYLVVEPTGAKRWTFVFRFRGKRKEFGLGSILDVSLADARDLAEDARALVKVGRNPIEEKRNKREIQQANQAADTFADVADQLIADLSPAWKSEIHIRQWRTTLTVDAAPLRGLQVSEITTDDVLSVLRPIWQVKPETASRLRGRIERVLDAAKAKGLRIGENPARWKGHLALMLSRRRKLTRGHHAALPYDRIGEFMAALRNSASLSARALEFTILTAARTGETRFAQLNEFDLEKAIWVVPGERMKRGAQHRVPLSPRAVKIVRELLPHARNGYLFPGLRRSRAKSDDKALSNMAMPKMLLLLGYAEFTVHGFRSTFKDWASDCTMFPREVSEAALSHVVGDAVEQSYRRGDALELRRQLMNAWASYCETVAKDRIKAIAA
jgi:integrase